MKITLQNDRLRAEIDDKGAELQSLFNKHTQLEYMWNGDPAYWGKYSPVLFPIVGSFKEDTYFYKGKSYQLPRHGFAREKIFQTEQISETEAVFTLIQDEQTLAVYPFEFNFKLHYSLDNDTITCTYHVFNTGTDDLLFSAGAHPAFAVPLVKGTNYDDYYLQFNQNEHLQRWELQDGLIGLQTEEMNVADNRIQLNKELFYKDAIVLKNLQSNCITLASNLHHHGLHFHFNGYPFFGIWAAKNASFVCLEPWCGIADSINSTQQFTEKEGICTIAPQADWKRSWNVQCY